MATTVQGANGYNGGTTIKSGTLRATNTSGSATGNGSVTVTSRGAIKLRCHAGGQRRLGSRDVDGQRDRKFGGVIAAETNSTTTGTLTTANETWSGARTRGRSPA